MMGVAVAVLCLAVIVIMIRRTRRHPMPCPWWLRFLLENPLMDRVAGPAIVMARLDLAPGMWVLDVGSGPGRLTIPVARHVGPTGRVVALDAQERMLAYLRDRATRHGLHNVEPVLGGAGEGVLGFEAVFDRALLVTVLGEIRERRAALGEILRALKPGGTLAVTEVLLDPDYQPAGTITRLAESVGFEVCARHGSVFAFTLMLRKPDSPGIARGES